MNPKYTFTYECAYPGQTPIKQTMEFEAETLSDILDQFERFLLGAGFSLKGPIEVNEPETCGLCAAPCEQEWCVNNNKGEEL